MKNLPPPSSPAMQSIKFRANKVEEELMAYRIGQKIQKPESEQEQQDYDQENEEESLFQIQDYSFLEPSVVVGNHFSKLCLDTTFNSPTAAAATIAASGSSPASASVSNSVPKKTLKRRSPSQSPPISQPNPKKEKLSLPPRPLLRRCISDSFNPTPPFDSFTPRPPPPLASTNKASAAASASSNKVNSKPTLRRSVSDPNPSPSPALKKTIPRVSPSSSDDDDTSPSSKRLRRIKDRIREMSLWFQQVMLDEDDQDKEEEEQVGLEAPREEHHQEQNAASPTKHNLNYNPNSSCATEDDDCERKFAESVRAERVGECLVLHFRCHCGIPYQFLLAGGSCYYKLM